MNKFQFHSGLIKSLYSYAPVAVFLVFQFHSGLIKSETDKEKISYITMFQFHSGLIKSGIGAYLAEQLQCFNSILV